MCCCIQFLLNSLPKALTLLKPALSKSEKPQTALPCRRTPPPCPSIGTPWPVPSLLLRSFDQRCLKMERSRDLRLVLRKNRLEDYVLGKTIGRGAFCKVKIAEHILTGRRVAIKVIPRNKIENKEMEEKVEREIKISRNLVHAHIARVYEVIETEEEIFLVMEYLPFGELFQYISDEGPLQEDEARHYLQQIICGVEYCHRNMVVHRDLKPENLLLSRRGNVKIIDFGLSNVMRDGHLLRTSCGSPNYAAPELLAGDQYAGPEVDVWSCGVILYGILCGFLPFDDSNVPQLFQKIKGGMYVFPEEISGGAKDLIARMLAVDPTRRITIPEIRRHPWFHAHLPRYLAVPPPDATELAKKIDDDILRQVVRMGFNRNELVDSLISLQQNRATVIYYLLLDKRFRASAGGYLGCEYQEMTDYEFEHPFHHAAARRRLPTPSFDACPHVSSPNWTLGFQCRGDHREIMREAVKAMKEWNVVWKKISGPYNLKCKWITSPHHHLPLHSQTNVLLKFEIKLYKEGVEKYLLDLQKLEGPEFVFLELYFKLMSKLIKFK